MSLLSNTVKSASTKIEFEYLGGDELFGYKITANYKVELADIQYTTEGGALLEGREALEAAYETQKITARIGGDEFTNGVLESISFSESPLVGNMEADISISQRTRLGDYSNSVFLKHIPNPHLVSEFSENFDFNRNEGGYSFSRNISLGYEQDAGGQFLNLAKNFLSNFYHLNRPNLGYYDDGISENLRFDQSNLRKSLSEEVDLINLKVTLSESLNSSFLESDYSRDEKHSISVNEQGFLEKSISVEVLALREPLEKVVTDAVATIIDDLSTTNYVTFGQPISIEKGIQKDGGKATLSVNFSTDPKYQNENMLTYIVTKKKNGSYTDYSSSFNYKSEGKTTIEKRENTKVFWSSQIESQPNKITGLFPSADLAEIYEKSRGVNFNYDAQTITEQIEYTTDPAFDGRYLESGILFFSKQVSDNRQVPRSTTVFSIETPSADKVFIKSGTSGELKTLGQGSVTMNTAGNPRQGLFFAKDFLNSIVPPEVTGVNVFVNSDQTDLNVAAGSCQRVIAFDYY
jgi:hypothetical protein